MVPTGECEQRKGLRFIRTLGNDPPFVFPWGGESGRLETGRDGVQCLSERARRAGDHSMSRPFSRIFVVSVLGILLLAPAGWASPGATVATDGTQIVDQDTGLAFTVDVNATEFHEPGRGKVTMLVFGPHLQFCTTHGPHFNQNTDITEPGIKPLADVECGNAGNMSVSIEGCVADIQAHGFVHADHPFVTYLGMATFDVRVQRTRSHDDVAITVWTPKAQIKLNGRTAGTATLSTCP